MKAAKTAQTQNSPGDHDQLTDEGILDFLAENDLNVFMNTARGGDHELATVLDFALAVDRPIGLSSSFVFHHVYSAKTCVRWQTLKQLMDQGIDHLLVLRKQWSVAALQAKFRKLSPRLAALKKTSFEKTQISKLRKHLLALSQPPFHITQNHFVDRVFQQSRGGPSRCCRIKDGSPTTWLDNFSFSETQENWT